MPSRCQLIRDYLRGKDPMGSAEIAQAIGLPALPVQHSIGNMVQSGILTRKGVGRCFTYSLAREVVTVRLTTEEVKARRAARERERYAAKGNRPRAEWLAYLAQCAAERKRKTAERKAQRKLELQEQRALASVVRKHTKPVVAKVMKPAKVVRKPTAAQQVHIAPAKQLMNVIVKPKPKVESVAEWMARTGKRPQVLPMGAVSRPLKFIGGQHAINEVTWKRRMAKAA
jgi:hypothetical protein